MNQPRHTIAGRRPVLLFDNDCGFCTRTVGWLRERGALHGTDTVAWRSVAPADLPVPPARLDREVVLLSGTSVLGGAAALAAALTGGSLPWRMVAGFLRAPGVRSLAAMVYRSIAANRHRLPGGSAACRVPTALRD